MPRPRRAQGRPGTAVIPALWETSHAVVASKTQTGTCVIRAQSQADSEPAMNDDLSFESSTAGQILYTGSCRIQALKTRQNGALVGEQDQRIAKYLVVIDREAGNIPDKSLIEVATSTDPTLASPLRLIVESAGRGTLRFERDLICIDDLTRGSA